MLLRLLTGPARCRLRRCSSSAHHPRDFYFSGFPFIRGLARAVLKLAIHAFGGNRKRSASGSLLPHQYSECSPPCSTTTRSRSEPSPDFSKSFLKALTSSTGSFTVPVP